MDISGLGSGISSMMSNYISETASSEVTESEFENLLNSAMNQEDDEGLREACQEFESYFLQQVYKSMRSTVPQGTLTEKSHGREMFEDMLDEEYAKEASVGKGTGIAQMLYKQLSGGNGIY